MARQGRPDLATILRTHGDAYLASHPALNRPQMKAWRAILACRTAALGGHLARCDACGTQRHVYHSCRNRHCPQCQTRAKEAWIAARSRELLPVPYFHLVFTVPHALNGLAALAPRRVYEALFEAVSDTLLTFAADPRHLGGVPAFTLVLHTWTQQLERHPHVHALVTGGALTGAGDRRRIDRRWRLGQSAPRFPVSGQGAVSGVSRQVGGGAGGATRQRSFRVASGVWRGRLARFAGRPLPA